MPRDIDAAVQASLEETSRSEIILVFVTVTLPNGADPIRIVSEENGGVSTSGGQLINYWLNDELHYALPFRFERLTDDDRPARGVITVPAFSNEIGKFLRTLSDPARLRVELYPLSSWGASLDADNAKSPTGTPEQLYLADHVYIRGASGDMSSNQCALGGYDFTTEPLGPRATKSLCPDLYR